MDKQTSVWLTEDHYQWLRQEAFTRGITQSQVIRDLIDAERARHENQS